MGLEYEPLSPDDFFGIKTTTGFVKRGGFYMRRRTCS